MGVAGKGDSEKCSVSGAVAIAPVPGIARPNQQICNAFRFATALPTPSPSAARYSIDRTVVRLEVRRRVRRGSSAVYPCVFRVLAGLSSSPLSVSQLHVVPLHKSSAAFISLFVPLSFGRIFICIYGVSLSLRTRTHTHSDCLHWCLGAVCAFHASVVLVCLFITSCYALVPSAPLTFPFRFSVSIPIDRPTNHKQSYKNESRRLHSSSSVWWPTCAASWLPPFLSLTRRPGKPRRLSLECSPMHRREGVGRSVVSPRLGTHRHSPLRQKKPLHV